VGYQLLLLLTLPRLMLGGYVTYFYLPIRDDLMGYQYDVSYRGP
jgi:hypothetical protein